MFNVAENSKEIWVAYRKTHSDGPGESQDLSTAFEARRSHGMRRRPAKNMIICHWHGALGLGGTVFL